MIYIYIHGTCVFYVYMHLSNLGRQLDRASYFANSVVKFSTNI